MQCQDNRSYFFKTDLSADGSTLFIVHAGEDRLTRVDFAARSVSTRPVRPALSWLERLLGVQVAQAKAVNGTTKQALLSPDSSRRYVTGLSQKSLQEDGEWTFEQTPLGLQVIDPATGQELRKLDSQATSLSLSAGGSFIILQGWDNDSSWSDLLIAVTLEPLHHLAGFSLLTALTNSGAPLTLLTSPTTQRAALIDIQSFYPGQNLSYWTMDGYPLIGIP